MGKENKYYVYALIDPINNIPFYIGKGCGDRAFHHLRPGEKYNKKKLKYIDAIRILHEEPLVRYIAKNLVEDDAYKIEGVCIKLATYIGFPITNSLGVDPPSRTGKRMSDSARERISEYQKSKINQHVPLSNETKLKISLALRGKPSYKSTQVECPQCSKQGSNRAMYRWHFDKCKFSLL